MKLHELVIFEELVEDPIIGKINELIAGEGDRRKVYFDLVRSLLSVEKSFKAYIYTLLLESPSTYLEKVSHRDYVMTHLDAACLSNDLMILSKLIHWDTEDVLMAVGDDHGLLSKLMSDDAFSGQIKAYDDYFQQYLQMGSSDEKTQAYLSLIRQYGTGKYATNVAFYMDHTKQLVPIERYEPLSWDHIYDYERQKKQLQRNTRALVEGRPFHHALLVGASGTGKSSSVKAVVELFDQEKLRLIQLQKSQLNYLPKLMESLSKSVFKFILYFDDLSFEVNEEEYKLLKSYIEGGIVNESNNIAFYVTSNRQHLIKEVRSDREGDIHLNDFIQEMTSLSKRFGLNLTFEGLTQKEYFEMVCQMLEDAAIPFDKEAMEVEARRWSLRQRGMSGRIANQFVKHLQMMSEGDITNNKA